MAPIRGGQMGIKAIRLPKHLIVFWIIGCSATCANSADQFEHQIANARSQLLSILFSGALDKELDILDSQRAKLIEIESGRQELLRSEFMKLQEALNRGDKDKTSLQQINVNVDARISTEISGVLLPQQEHRWKQIGRQLMFGNDRSLAFLIPDVGATLGLSDDQTRELRQKFKDGERERREADVEIRKQREAKMLDILSVDQKAKWEELFGKPFLFGKE